MIKELENLLNMQAEVDALKEKIATQMVCIKKEADETVEAKKKEIEKDIQEIVEYLNKAGFYNYIYILNGASNKNQKICFKLSFDGYYIGYVTAGVGYSIQHGYFNDEVGSSWDRRHIGGHTPGTISSVTVYLCHNWDVIKNNLVNEIAKDIGARQQKELDDALKQLKYHVERIVA